MKVTTRHLLKFLPIEEKLKQETISRLEGYTSDQKLALDRLLWSMFYEILDADADYEFRKAMFDIKDGKRKMEKNLYKKVADQVYLKFMRDLRDEQETFSIEEARSNLQQIITEKVKKIVK